MRTKRVLLLMALLASIGVQCYSQTTIGRQRVDQYPTTAWGTLTYGLTWLPTDYNTNTSQRYPLIIFLHGSGEGGTTVGSLNNLLVHGLPKHIANGFNPEAVNPVDGQNYKFIVVSPQAPGWSYAWGSIQWILPDVISRYRIDTNRIYVTGISAGGAGTISCVTNGAAPAAKFAAVVPVSAAGTNSSGEADQIPLIGGTYGKKLWAIAGANESWLAFSQNMVTSINNAVPPPAVPATVTAIPGGGHNAATWDPAYNANWRSNVHNLNIYEWMLQYTRTTAPASNPTANAGTNQSITLPATSVTLSGSGTAVSPNTISSYAWTQVSGPSSATFATASSASTAVTGLVPGTYVFRLTVTDNAGGTGTATVTVTVINPAPVANAGTDQYFGLPLNTTTLNGSASDPDGSVTAYQWTRISGPTTYSLANATTANASATGLVAGTYVFEFRVTDNWGAIGRDTMSVTVYPAPNSLPLANAGSDTTITLPASTANLNGSGSDADGTVASYAWTRVSGPTAHTIANASNATTTVSGLVQGVYRFELTVTDNSGGIAKDTMQVTVNAAPNQAPSVTAGADTTITLPVDSILLNGSATDSDGSIASYRWSKISGPASHAFADSTQAQTEVDNLVAGTYRFEWTVTDNNGASTSDTMQVQVNPAPAVPVAPVVLAGMDTTITLPLDSVLLTGSASDSDGTIISRRWRKISGPTSHIFTDSTQAQTSVGNLAVGVYQFEFSATDNDSLSAADTVQVTVLSNPSVTGCGGVKRYLVPSANTGGRFISATDSTFYMQVNPGDTLVLRAQYNWNYFAMKDYNGTPGCPIVVMNEGGQTWLTAGIEVQSCQYVKVTGSGHPSTYYGFKVYKPGDDGAGVAISVIGRSKNVEIDRIDVYRKTYGVWAKQDPTCDPAFNYPSWRMDSIEIHHSRFRNIGQDGIYAGNTDPLGLRTVWCNGQETHPIPMRLSNINIHHLIIDSCNRTAIQLCGADSGYNQIHHNTITGAGFEFNQQQGFGIAIGGMTRNCHVYNNDIKNTFLYGIVSFGVGTNYIENNRIDSSGFLNGAPNTWSRPVNILASPKTTLPFDSTRIIIRNNIMGANATTDSNNIALVVWGPPTWASGNVVCNNTRMATGAAALLYIDPSIDYIDNCSQVLGNMSPTANAGADQDHPGSVDSVQVQGSGTDPDGTIIAYRWQQVSGPNTATIAQPDSATTDFTGLVQGVYVFRLTVMDDDSATATDDIVIRIAPANTPPVANAGLDQLITLPVDYVTMNGGGTDPDGQVVSYQWNFIVGPAAYNIVNANDPLTEINGLTQGIYRFELVVTDDSGAIDRDTVVIRVNPPSPAGNLAPVVNAGPDQTIGLPTNMVNLNGSATDADGTVASYRWTKISGPAQFFISNNSITNPMVFNLVPGVYLFELRATDDQGAIGRDTVRITVNSSSNLNPVVNAGPDQAITLPVNSVSLNGVGVDPDGTIVSYQWTTLSGPASYSFGNQAAAQTTFGNLVVGTYTLELQVIDDQGASARDTVVITVSPAPPPPANVLPVANAGIDQVITLPANSVTLLGSGTDTDGTITAYQWTAISGPAGAAIAQPDNAQTAINNLVAGTYLFELAVTDNSGGIGRDTVQITVNPAVNLAPFAFAGADQTITLPTNSLSLSGNGIDADGTITAYAWNVVSGPAGASFGSPNTATTTFSGLVQGTYQVQLTVTDNNGATGRDTVLITVNAAPPPPPNMAPFAIAGANQQITLPASTITLSGAGVDVDGSIASYQWRKISGPALFVIANTTSATTLVTNLEQGLYQFELQVTDNQGAVGRDTMEVTVSPMAPNLPPVANAGVDQVITLPVNTASLVGSGSDADGTIVSYQWTKISGPASFSILAANQPQTSVTGLQQGVYEFELAVTDNRGAIARDTVQITVNATPNVPPVANAGPDQTLTLPVNAALLHGVGVDVDGTIATYQWRKISGPNFYTIVSSNSAQTNVLHMIQGTYRFELRVTDNFGAEGRDTMTIVINQPTTTNQPPIVNAGADQTIISPVSVASLNGSALDPDGVVVGFAWTKISGPQSFLMANPSAAQTSVANLVEGVYQFELRAMDNSGAVGRDTVTITVQPNTIPFSTATVFPNPAKNMLYVKIAAKTNRNDTELRIYDMRGRLVYEEFFVRNQHVVVRAIDISRLPAGTYVIQTEADINNDLSIKFVKQ